MSLRCCTCISPSNAQLALEQRELEQYTEEQAAAVASESPKKTLAATSDEDDNIRVIFSLPASAAGHDLALTLSPRKNQAPGQSSQRNSSNNDGPPPSWSLPTSGGGTGQDPFAQGDQAPPSSQPITSVHDRHAVSDAYKARYPSNPLSDGWKVQKWYVIRRGLEIGIFYDFWFVFLHTRLRSFIYLFCRGHILPFVKNENGVNYQGASYKGATSYADARGIWRFALNNNQVRCLA